VSTYNEYIHKYKKRRRNYKTCTQSAKYTIKQVFGVLYSTYTTSQMFRLENKNFPSKCIAFALYLHTREFGMNYGEQAVFLVLAGEEGCQLIHRHDGEAGAQRPVQNRFPARELLSHGQQLLHRQAAQAFHHVRLTASRLTNIPDCNFFISLRSYPFLKVLLRRRFWNILCGSFLAAIKRIQFFLENLIKDQQLR
jgi:hypothetical protein